MYLTVLSPHTKHASGHLKEEKKKKTKNNKGIIWSHHPQIHTVTEGTLFQYIKEIISVEMFIPLDVLT